MSVLLVDPHWADPQFAKIKPYTFVASKQQDVVETGLSSQYRTFAPGRAWFEGTFSHDLSLPMFTERWLIADGYAVGRIVLTKTSVSLVGFPLYSWTSRGIWRDDAQRILQEALFVKR